MAFFKIDNIKISGISSCVPKATEENSQLDLPVEDLQKLISTTGIERRRIATSKQTTADLCFNAAHSLLNQLDWDSKDIECLIFVTQTPDYILPATSCILQDKLGLSNRCYCLDISLGCSGWVYGLSTIASIMKAGGLKKGILLAGDTISKICSKNDKSTWPLFGDAGTCTAIELTEDSSGFLFNLNTDGAGYKSIIIPDGGYRNIFCLESLNSIEFSQGICRSKMNLELDGMDVFTFGISKAPKSVTELIEEFDIEDIDYFVFHQANMLMNEKIRKKLKLDVEKVPYSLKDFGNTSSATIPLTITSALKSKLKENKKIIATGFGVGLSWGSVAFDLENVKCPDLIEI